MTILLDAAALDARRSVAAGALRALADGLLAELAPLLDGRVQLPTEKALLTRTGGRAFSNAVDLVLATMACHGSIRAGDPLAAGEVKALLEALDEADFAGHCPHGRPVVTFLSWAELERKVGLR